ACARCGLRLPPAPNCGPAALSYFCGCGVVPPRPTVAVSLSGIHFIAERSYLNPGAPFSESLVAFMTGYQLLSFFLKWTEAKDTATSFSLMPRKRPTPMMSV